MRLIATFANRSFNPQEIELVHCWDEYCVDGNEQGFREARQKALDALGPDLLHWTTVEIALNPESMARVEACLTDSLTMKGTVLDV